MSGVGRAVAGGVIVAAPFVAMGVEYAEYSNDIAAAERDVRCLDPLLEGSNPVRVEDLNCDYDVVGEYRLTREEMPEEIVREGGNTIARTVIDVVISSPEEIAADKTDKLADVKDARFEKAMTEAAVDVVAVGGLAGIVYGAYRFGRNKFRNRQMRRAAERAAADAEPATVYDQDQEKTQTEAPASV